ncbi:hypothetical protein [Terriglobus sp.]|uniref:hypothetical protein n=1 Tax=Terriglobus sp. TaxID=1889013 RepID=UPI003B005B5B
MIAAIAAVYAVTQAPTYWSLQERNLFRNLLAEPMWECSADAQLRCSLSRI